MMIIWPFSTTTTFFREDKTKKAPPENQFENHFFGLGTQYWIDIYNTPSWGPSMAWVGESAIYSVLLLKLDVQCGALKKGFLLLHLITWLLLNQFWIFFYINCIELEKCKRLTPSASKSINLFRS